MPQGSILHKTLPWHSISRSLAPCRPRTRHKRDKLKHNLICMLLFSMADLT